MKRQIKISFTYRGFHEDGGDVLVSLLPVVIAIRSDNWLLTVGWLSLWMVIEVNRHD